MLFRSDSDSLYKESNENKRPISRSYGRWTKKECKLFEEALNKYGNHWKKVEAYVGTRNGTQIRSHAQKYFLKLKEKKEKDTSISGAHEGSASPEKIPHIEIIPEKNNVKSTQEKELGKLPPLSSMVGLDLPPPIECCKVNKNITTSMKSDPKECSFLVEYMKGYGINSLEEIYEKYTKLSHWVCMSDL